MNILITNRQRQRPLNKVKITKIVRYILSYLELPSAEISILFVGNRRMLQLNNAYRGVNKATDVLSFEAGLSIDGRKVNNILGDIVINVQRAESQARQYGISFYDELSRLLIHGVLHLLGYDHEGSNYQARKMKKKEEEIFNAIKKMDTKC